MEDFRYLPGATSLVYDKESCVGCGSCAIVCPHGVFVMNEKKARIWWIKTAAWNAAPVP